MMALEKQISVDNPVYLDYQATTPCDPRVIEEMRPFFETHFGNPHSRSHVYGWTAEDAAERGRRQVADLIGADAKDILFTSGATEANNLALKGVAAFYKDQKNHIITTNVEHKCVLNTARYLEQQGFKVTYLPVLPNGLIDLSQLADAITDKTALVSVMAVHNEIGVIQPLKEIGALCRAKGVFFHTDAAQAAGRISLDVDEMNIDLMSLSGHKVYGPKGIGALYVRRKPRVRLVPLIHGGGQERGMRSGTLPTPLCVGFGKACEIARQDFKAEGERTQKLSQRLYSTLANALEKITLNGDEKNRVPHNLNISFNCVEGESLMMGLKDLAVSSGSACTSASLEPSYVLRALGVDDGQAHSSIRFGIGRFTTEEEIDYAASRVISEVNRLRDMSPLWEMSQEGIDLSTIEWDEH